MAAMNLDNVGGRRFALTVATQISVTALVWFGKVSGEVYAATIIATVAAYITGNVTERIKAHRAPPGAQP